MSHLIFGASGQVGHFLLPRLATRGDAVCALSRSVSADDSVARWLQGALPNAPGLPQQPVALISLGPLTAFAEWLERAPLRSLPRVVALSSMSALSKHDSPDPAERAMIRTLLDAEQRVIACCERRGLRWTLLRPTLIYGAGTDKSLTPIARTAMRWRLFPLPQGRGLRQPVHADDLALAVLGALDEPRSAGCVIAVGGGERLRASAMFARVRRALPVWTLPLPIPHGAFGMLARLLPQRAAMIGRLDIDLVADTADAERLLGLHARAFEPHF
ncbi:MAG: NAD-dependent epimerase/dehydratase family protein [Dokdonella sp.]